MSAAEGRSAGLSSVSVPALSHLVDSVQLPIGRIPSGMDRMLYYSMRHRTQLYLDGGQYRWLKQRAGEAGSIAAVVRELIDAERARGVDPAADPLLSYLVDEAPGSGRKGTSVSDLDRDLYGP
jgi:hypothetical protein